MLKKAHLLGVILPLFFSTSATSEVNNPVLNDTNLRLFSTCAVTSRVIWGEFGEWTRKEEHRTIELANKNQMDKWKTKAAISELHRNILTTLKNDAKEQHTSVENLAYAIYMKQCHAQ